MPRFVPALGTAAVLVAAALALNFVAVTAPRPPVDLGIFEPVAGRIVYGNQGGIWGVDPASSDPTTRVLLISEAGTPLAWSSDGTRLLIQKSKQNLFVLHADGSETQVTRQLSGFDDIPGSARPAGATISPDGSRVVFAGLTTALEDRRSCHDGALFAVDADAGPAEVLWESQVPQNGIVRDPTFSPDGTRIAFVDGYCDSSHSVWVMNADGGDAHPIVTGNDTPLGGTHVYGLAWSPAGDRIALAIDEGIYTFATDGSDFTRIAAGSPSLAWSPDGSRIAYSTGCTYSIGTADVDGCTLSIADADGSNVRKPGFGISGPWHPGRPVTPTTGQSPPKRE